MSQTGGSASAAFNLSYGAGGASNVITAEYNTGATTINATSAVALTANGGNSSDGTVAKFSRGGSEKNFYISSTNNQYINLATEGDIRLRTGCTVDQPYATGINALILASTGAATFTSTVTAAGTGGRSVVLTGAGSGQVAINGDNSTYATSIVFNNQAGGTTLSGIWAYGSGATLNWLGLGGIAYNGASIYLPPSGNVGIGASGPLSLLQVGSIGNASVRFGTSSTTNTSATYSFVAWNTSGNDILGARGDGLVYAPYIYSTFTTGAAANMGIDSAGGFYRSVSSIKYKKNVENYTKGLAEVMQIRPVFYNSINEKEDGILYAGLIAEEVHELGLTEFVQYAKDGTPDALAYQNMSALAFKAIQEMNTKISQLEQLVATK
jgi:hypothetical protein